MDKLELKHIAPYLPYGLNAHVMGEVNEDDGKPKTFEIVGVSFDFVEYLEEARTVTEYCVFSDCFPILHPLSDLTKPIWHKGKEFVPFDQIGGVYNTIEYLIEEILNGLVPTIIWYSLVEWKIDVWNLIPKGLAIDVNTLEHNPYKEGGQS